MQRNAEKLPQNRTELSLCEPLRLRVSASRGSLQTVSERKRGRLTYTFLNVICRIAHGKSYNLPTFDTQNLLS